MPRWLMAAVLAVLSWGVWAILSRFIGETITAAQSQALSTLGLLPVMIALSCSKKLTTTATGARRKGIIAGFAPADQQDCTQNNAQSKCSSHDRSPKVIN